MRRNIHRALAEWRKSASRDVLLVRGARQVGKTFSVRELGKTFPHFVEVNLEENTEVHSFFRGRLTPAPLCEKLSAYFATPILPGETLLFFDELQACPNALRALRFFREQMPRLHVVGAGSLLEFALAQLPSMGVGRITSLFMYPLTFEEFLLALGEDALSGVVARANATQPIAEPLHQRLVELLRTYLLIGGMPAVVNSYVEKHDLTACFKRLDDLLLTLEDDFAKYRERAPVHRMLEVFRSIAFQAGGKFKFARVDSPASSRVVREALTLLLQAGLAHRVTHTDARGLPLGAQVDPRKFKVLLFDVGIHQRLLGLDVPSYLTAEDVELVNRGSLAEVFAGLELLARPPVHTKPALYYWHREARASNAEVDYVLQDGAAVLPVEVKAGTRGQMQSLRLFLDERGLTRGIRASLENFSRYERVEVIPLYAIARLGRRNARGGEPPPAS
ncbi:MAG: AAA family ATPase [Planctomycetes bacterium]|nr:AAA family ATPase [Planctomycetota bacterium]